MNTHLQWPLVAAWTLIGALAGTALSDPFSRWVLLLVPVGLVVAGLLWTVEFGRETAAVLMGLSSYPLLLAFQARNPACLAAGEFATCQPSSAWPWLGIAAALVITGSAVVMAGASPSTRVSH